MGHLLTTAHLLLLDFPSKLEMLFPLVGLTGEQEEAAEYGGCINTDIPCFFLEVTVQNTTKSVST